MIIYNVKMRTVEERELVKRYLDILKGVYGSDSFGDVLLSVLKKAIKEVKISEIRGMK